MSKYQEYQEALDLLTLSNEYYGEDLKYFKEKYKIHPYEAIQELVDKEKIYTEEEIKKEWEELGWFFIGLPEDVKNKVSCITINKYVGKNIFSTTDIQLDLEQKDCFIRGLINYRELQLLTKTLKWLGWEV